MASSFVQLPSDTGNTGKKIGSETQVIGADTVHFHRYVQSDKTLDQTAGVVAKGLQATYGTACQDFKDSGRVLYSATATGVTGATSEALVTLTPYRDLTAGGGATTFPVTSGKRLRLTKWVVTWRNNTAAAGGVTCRFRMLAGTVLVSSPVHDSLNATTSLATVGSGLTVWSNFPDGFELSGTMQFGVTQIAVGAVVGFDVHVLGFEY